MIPRCGFCNLFLGRREMMCLIDSLKVSGFQHRFYASTLDVQATGGGESGKVILAAGTEREFRLLQLLDPACVNILVSIEKSE
jgi:hypothetical protein